ncbi:MAG: type IV secretion system DNA-binding domain-containing protein [Proteobacteria bacterium]|nr:type IV secretion system DNA-binding domain-containing protein [Pseudomonadota bacterium]
MKIEDMRNHTILKGKKGVGKTAMIQDLIRLLAGKRKILIYYSKGDLVSGAKLF